MIESGLMAFPPGLAVPITDAGRGVLWNIAMTLSGEAEELRQDGRTHWTKGDFFALKPGVKHGWRVLGDAPWQVVWFLLQPGPELLPLLALPEVGVGSFLVRLGGACEERRVRQALLEARARLGAGARPTDLRLAHNALERALLWVGLAVGRDGRLDVRLERALAFARRRLSDGFTLREMSRAAGVSASRLHQLFMAGLGLPPMAFVERERLRQAAALLEGSDLSVKEVAMRCGYANQRYFATRFKAVEGRTPSETRG